MPLARKKFFFNWVYDYSIIIIDLDVHRAIDVWNGRRNEHLYEKWVLVLTYVKPCVLGIWPYIKKAEIQFESLRRNICIPVSQSSFMLQITDA